MVFKGCLSVCLTDDCLHVCSEAISCLVFNIHYKKRLSLTGCFDFTTKIVHSAWKGL